MCAEKTQGGARVHKALGDEPKEAARKALPSRKGEREKPDTRRKKSNQARSSAPPRKDEEERLPVLSGKGGGKARDRQKKKKGGRLLWEKGGAYPCRLQAREKRIKRERCFKEERPDRDKKQQGTRACPARAGGKKCTEGRLSKPEKER